MRSEVISVLSLGGENQYGMVYGMVSYHIVWYGIVLYRTVSYRIVSYRSVVYCIVLYCIVLYCIVLYCIVLYCLFPFIDFTNSEAGWTNSARRWTFGNVVLCYDIWMKCTCFTAKSCQHLRKQCKLLVRNWMKIRLEMSVRILKFIMRVYKFSNFSCCGFGIIFRRKYPGKNWLFMQVLHKTFKIR